MNAVVVIGQDNSVTLECSTDLSTQALVWATYHPENGHIFTENFTIGGW